MEIAEGIKYTKEHEWVKVEGGTAVIGITDYAQEHLGDIVYVDLPKVGDVFEAGDVLSAVDSVKTASDIFSPVSGTVTKVNDALDSAPETMNTAPYDAWIAALEMTDEAELIALMDADAYRQWCNAEEENA